MKFWLQTYKLILCKWGHFDRVKPIFKMLPGSTKCIVLLRSFRSFQRGTASLCRSKGCKVVSGKLEIWKKFCCSTHCRLFVNGLGSIPGRWDHPQSLINNNIAAPWPRKTCSTSVERPKPYSNILSVYETGRIFRIGFDLSMWSYTIVLIY